MKRFDPQSCLCIACNYPLVHGLEGRCPECGRPFDLSDPRTFNPTGKPVGAVARFWLATPAWPALVVCIPVLVYGLWFLREPQAAMTSLGRAQWYVACELAVAAGALQWGMRWRTRKRFGQEPFLRQLQSRWPTPLLLLVPVILALLAAECRCPMRVAFWASESSLNALADRAVANPAGAASLAPATASLFRIEAVEVGVGRAVALYTGMLGPYPKWGFARLPGWRGRVPVYTFFGRGVTLHVVRLERLRGDWFVVYD